MKPENISSISLILLVLLCIGVICYLINDMNNAIVFCNNQSNMDNNTKIFNDCLATKGWAPLGYDYIE